MKQTALLSITVATLLALSACGGEKAAEPAKPASAASGASADAAKTYTVVMDDSFAPFESLDDKGNIVGFDKDIIDAIAAKENLSLKFVARPFDGIFETLKYYNFDILLLPPGDILLPSLNYGFIGGVGGMISNDRMAFFGDLDSYKWGDEIKKFLYKYDISPIALRKGKLIDRGSLLTL